MTWKKITAVKTDNTTWVETRDGDFVHRNGRWLLRFPNEVQQPIAGIGGSSWSSVYGQDPESANRWHLMEIKPMYRKDISSRLTSIAPGSGRKYIMRPEHAQGATLYERNFETIDEAKDYANKTEMIKSFLQNKRMEDAYAEEPTPTPKKKGK